MITSEEQLISEYITWSHNYPVVRQGFQLDPPLETKALDRLVAISGFLLNEEGHALVVT